MLNFFAALMPSPLTPYVVPSYNIVEGNFEIMPGDIPAQFAHLGGAFGECLTEVSAKHIVHYFQEQGTWKSFTFGQINHFYRKRVKIPSTFRFYRLVEAQPVCDSRGGRMEGGGWIVRKDGRYYVTDDFIRRVYNALVKH